uniref:Peptidase C1A papain C-terminal domain-containing protein n=1 Tax=Hyaloperonospora arabidopsidis (strain Emoy2) TaxID=559515 RepID=M4B737_HYAAE
MHVHVAVVALCVAIAATTAIETTDRPFGTLLRCPPARSVDSPCLWAGENGQLVDPPTLRGLVLKRYGVHSSEKEFSRRNLEHHMTYLEDVTIQANKAGLEFSYDMGVHERHLILTSRRDLTPEQFVQQEVQALAVSRRLQVETNSSDLPMPPPSSSNTLGAGSSSYWNWCDSSNSQGHSVCSPVKSQKSCGSCWSFVAADAIETAVVIAENTSAAVSLSPQQFLMCSTLQTTQTFDYCWASDNGVPGASWMQTQIKWESQNDGCNGGMTHAAFMDAAQRGWGLVTELTMPYDDSNPGSFLASNMSSVCNVPAEEAAASITGWEQIVGIDCSVSSNCTLLLRAAVERQPIAVAITSNGGFGEYRGGFYTCPNNGEMASKNDLNHALLLVGYGTDSTHGDYWILKNSYGSSWGDNGFMKLVADAKINCGLNVFPVIPTGARAGAQASTAIDSGGDKIFVGLSQSAWIAVAAATTAFTLITTGIGVGVSNRKLKHLHQQHSAMYTAVCTPTNGG